VIVFSQNCPQFIVAYFAILRAHAVFVPVNAMLLLDELAHIVNDSGALAAFVASELFDRVMPLLSQSPLRRLIVHAYGDALGGDDAGLPAPDWLRARLQPSRAATHAGVCGLHRAVCIAVTVTRCHGSPSADCSTL
jgi:long-chain acyl-CoA synthetase